MPNSAVENSQFPIDEVAQAVCDRLAETDVILTAPPGAGKSTRLPLRLLEESLNGKIILLQPRRVVARQLASFMARQLGESVGQRVGYRIRGESKISRETQLEIVTEGVLSRMLQSDPQLDGVALIIFDEFHERNIHADVGLALALEVRRALRDDLRLLIMSATLDVEPLQNLIPEACTLHCEGRQFPVTEEYVGVRPNDDIPTIAAREALKAMQSMTGDVLVFMPGARWIRATERILNSQIDAAATVVLPLYGALTPQQQDLALSPDSKMRRKIIVATNVAETSLTIDGVTIVVDSGRENTAQFHLDSQMRSMSSSMISRASSIQRMGRAGRTAPGHCIRLWPKEQQERLATSTAPQILREDIASVFMDALQWGTVIDELPLLDQPTAAQKSSTQTLFERLALIDESGRLTDTGRKAAHLPCHPRLAAMLVWASDYFEGDNTALHSACLAAALLEQAPSMPDWDCAHYGPELPPPVRQNLVQQVNRFAQILSLPRVSGLNEFWGLSYLPLCIARAYPEYVAQRQPKGRYKLASGVQGEFHNAQATPEWVVMLDGQREDSGLVRIFTALSLVPDALSDILPTWMQDSANLSVDTEGRMTARKVLRFGQIIIRQLPNESVKPQHWQAAWVDYLQQQNELPFSEAANQLRYRIALAKQLGLPCSQSGFEEAPWPDVSQDALLSTLDRWCAQRFERCRTKQSLSDIDWADALWRLLNWAQQDVLQRELPKQIVVPSGQQRNLRYREDGNLVLAVKIQEMFGQNKPLAVAQGRVPITIELLSPAGRIIQTTTDLMRFWQGSYAEVKKEMKGRYPKHVWPDDPANAAPTTRTKKYSQ